MIGKRQIKVFLLMVLVVYATSGAQADPSFKTAGPVSQAVQKYTGVTLVSGFLVSRIASFAVHSQLGGKVKIKITPYSFTDLLSGKVKSIKIALANCNYRSMKLPGLQVESANPLWLKCFPVRKCWVRTPIMFKLAGQVSSDEISQGLASPSICQALRMVKFDLPGLGKQQLQFLDPQVKLQEQGVVIQSTITTIGANQNTGIRVSLSGKPVLDGSRILVKGLEVSSPDVKLPPNFGEFMAELFNPLVDFARMDRIDHAFRPTGFELGKGEVKFSGTLVLAPKPAAPHESKRG